jgi:hypothetical protein
VVAAVVGLVLFALPGCARLPVRGELPAGMAVIPLATVAPASPFACAPTGGAVAFVDNGLRLAADGEGEGRVVAADEPYLLAWSPDGARLATASGSDEATVLRLFSASGVLLGESRLTGRVADLGWSSPTELLALALRLETFSFGGNVRELLYRWNGTDEAKATTIADSSLMRATLLRWGGLLPGMLHLSVSPWGEAIVYTRFHDPPAFSPYLKVILRHLESGAEREMAQVSLNSGGAQFMADGTEVVYGDGSAASVVTDPWGEERKASFPVAGRAIATSPGGVSLLIDGRLYRDGREVAVFPTVSGGCFAHGGQELIVRSGSRLFRVTGLPRDEATPVPPEERRRLEALRRWRIEGLITVEEYRHAAAKGDRK